MNIPDEKIQEYRQSIYAILTEILDRILNNPDDIIERILLAHYDGQRALLIQLFGTTERDPVIPNHELLRLAAFNIEETKNILQSALPTQLDDVEISPASNQPAVEV